MSKLSLIGFFVLAPVTIALSIASLINLDKRLQSYVPDTAKTGIRVFASLPSSVPEIVVDPTPADAREEILKKYFKEFGSPLLNYTSFIISEADKEGIDFRLIPAIARQESGLCKFIPENSYNCWGWGITSVGTLYFNSYEEGIRAVTEGLKANYIDQGLKTPEDIMAKYTPQSKGSWANGVNEFMKDLE